MRRDELVEGEWYLMRKNGKILGAYKCNTFCRLICLFDYDLEGLIERDYEWARINPEEIFKEKILRNDISNRLTDFEKAYYRDYLGV